MSDQTPECTATGIDEYDRANGLVLGHDGPHFIAFCPDEDGPVAWSDGTETNAVTP